MANVPESAVLLALQTRYDFQSARTMLKAGLKSLGLESKKEYSDEECQRLVGFLADEGERDLQSIVDAFAAPEAPPKEDKKDDKKEDKQDDKKPAKGKKK